MKKDTAVEATPPDAVDAETTRGAVAFTASILATELVAEATELVAEVTAATGVCLTLEIPVGGGANQVPALIELLECVSFFSNEFSDFFGIINAADNSSWLR